MKYCTSQKRKVTVTGKVTEILRNDKETIKLHALLKLSGNQKRTHTFQARSRNCEKRLLASSCLMCIPWELIPLKLSWVADSSKRSQRILSFMFVFRQTNDDVSIYKISSLKHFKILDARRQTWSTTNIRRHDAKLNDPGDQAVGIFAPLG
jgi:hypothetical protein